MDGDWVSDAIRLVFNTLRLRWNCHHFTDNILKCISLMKMSKFRLRCHRSLSLRVQLTIFQHWWYLGVTQCTSHYLNQWWLDNSCIYASSSLYELINWVINWVETKCTWHFPQYVNYVQLRQSSIQLNIFSHHHTMMFAATYKANHQAIKIMANTYPPGCGDWCMQSSLGWQNK